MNNFIQPSRKEIQRYSLSQSKPDSSSYNSNQFKMLPVDVSNNENEIHPNESHSPIKDKRSLTFRTGTLARKLLLLER